MSGLVFKGDRGDSYSPRPEMDAEDAYLTLVRALLRKGLLTVDDLESAIVGWDGYGYFRHHRVLNEDGDA